MPSFSNLPSDDVWRLVTYIKSLSGQLGGQGKITGDAKAGEQVFFGKGGCAACHEVDGRGADLATDLSAEGTKPGSAIKAGVQHPDPPPFRTHAAFCRCDDPGWQDRARVGAQ